MIGSGLWEIERRVRLKRYQINRKRAVQAFKKHAQEANPPIQMVFPLAEVVARLQEGMKELVGMLLQQTMQETMQQEVRFLVGDRGQPNDARQAYRWGSEQGYCVVQGQKLHLGRPRVVDKRTHRELPLGSYELFQRACLMEDAVWAKMMRQVSTRNYSELLQQFSETYGVKKSAVSEHFIACSRQKLQQLLERPLTKLNLCALLLDGTIFQAEHLIVPMGITSSGHKVFLGLRQGATENAEVVKALLGDLQDRGLDFNVPRLYVLDGAKALRRGVERYAGEAAVFQRCQVHKMRNVAAHLPEGYDCAVKARMQAAYSSLDYGEAKAALARLHAELIHRNPSAAASLAEGMEETLSVHRLRMAPLLRRTFSTTNPIESAFSVVETICRNVKHWSGGDQRLRWIASSLAYAESRFRRLQGFQQIPFLIKELELLTLKRDLKVRHAGVA